LNRGKGKFYFNELSFAQKDHPPLLNFPRELTLDVDIRDGETRINMDSLGLYLHSVPQGGFDVAINDLSKLLEHSDVLRLLKIKSGSLHLITASPSSPLKFSGELSSFYEFFVQDGMPQSDYV
jgi:hypothetical protein